MNKKTNENTKKKRKKELSFINNIYFFNLNEITKKNE